MAKFRVVIREVVQQDLEFIVDAETNREAVRRAMADYYHDSDLKVLVGKTLTVNPHSVRAIKAE